MKKAAIVMLFFISCYAAPVQVLVQNPEVAPRGDVHFLYSPQEFNPTQLMFEFTSGSEIHESEIPFDISGTDPVVVDNGIFKFSVSLSGQAQIIVGSDIVTIVPEIYDGASHTPTISRVQVFPGSKMTYLMWTPMNSTYTVHRIARVWYNKPWVEIETLISSSSESDIDFREHLDSVNVGSAVLDNLTIPLKSGVYDMTPSNGTYEPTEGWIVAYDGENALGMGLEAERWDLQVVGSDMNFLTHQQISLPAGTQSTIKSYYYILDNSGDMRDWYIRFRGGVNYRFNLTSDWRGGTVGEIENGRRDENATFYLPAPTINASLARLDLQVGAVLGSNPNLECRINGFKLFERAVPEPTVISTEVPVHWLEFGNNTVTCFADGGDIVVNSIELNIASVEGINSIYGGEVWGYATVNLRVNQTSGVRVDLDMRDLGIARCSPTVIVFDSAFRRIYSEYTYPILSFNSTLLANITNTFIISYGTGETVEFSGSVLSGQFADYIPEIVTSGNFGVGVLEREVHEERGTLKKEIPKGAQTGGGKILLYEDGLGAIVRLVIWR